MDKKTPSILIVGGGLAGVFCALKLAPSPVKSWPRRASAASRPGRRAASRPRFRKATRRRFTPPTIAAGAGLVDADIALGVALEARARIDDLAAFATPSPPPPTNTTTPHKPARRARNDRQFSAKPARAPASRRSAFRFASAFRFCRAPISIGRRRSRPRPRIFTSASRRSCRRSNGPSTRLTSRRSTS